MSNDLLPAQQTQLNQDTPGVPDKDTTSLLDTTNSPLLSTIQKADLLMTLIQGGSVNQFLQRHNLYNDAVYRTIASDPAFREIYARARAYQGDTIFDKILHIQERMLSMDLDPQVGREVSHNLKWIAAKLQPRKYGEQVKVDLTVTHKASMVDYITQGLAKRKGTAQDAQE